MPSLDGSFPPSAISEKQAKQLTHINFAFIGINEKFECDFVDGDDKTTAATAMAELQALKKWNPQLKTLVSLGGWAESNDDSPRVARYRTAFDSSHRAKFVDSCISFMQNHGFNGIDIDWEYPRYEDVDNFIAGLSLFRTKLTQRNQGELLTIAGAGGAFFMSRYYHKLPQIVDTLDFINLMTYDLNGPWQGVSKTNFHAHLYGNSAEPRFYNALREAQLGLTWEEIVIRFPSPFALTVDAAVKQHLMTNIPREKIVMGVPFYGRAFFNTGTNNNGLYQTFSTPNGDPYVGDPYVGDPSLLIGCDTCTARGEPRIATYNEIEKMMAGNFGYSYHFDQQTKAPYLYHAKNRIFVTYDNADSLRYKTDYIKNQGLGGVMFWHLGQDNTQFVLLNTLHEELNGANAGSSGGSSDSGDTSGSGGSSGSDGSSGSGGTGDSGGTGGSGDTSGSGSDCTAPAFVSGSTYITGNIVSHNTTLYECLQGGWCSSTAAWAYEPGKGLYWSDAWKETSSCTGSGSGGSGSGSGGSDSGSGSGSGSGGSEVNGVYTITAAQLANKELELTSSDLMKTVKASIATRDNATVEAVTVGNITNPTNVRRVESIISAGTWEYIFPRRAPEYTYLNFLKAIAKFPSFCGDYTDGRDANAICRKALATMFAHFTQETGGHTSWWAEPQWRQGLVYVREVGWDENMRGGYNGECNPTVWQGQTWPCGTFSNGDFKSYFGRGAKQLSYNYNYGPFSEAMYGNVRVLLDNPEKVADTWLNLASAVFFYIYPQPPKPSMLHVVDGTWVPNSADIASGLTPGFGVTTQIINGGVECGGTVEVQQSINRIDYYTNFANYLSVPVPSSEVLGCKGMKQFDSSGSGALNIYWEKDWGYDASTSTGQTYACKLVGYQTPYSVFKQGDYAKCVDAHFDVNITQ